MAVNGHEITGSTSSDELLEYCADTVNLTVCRCCHKPHYWEEPLLPWKQSQLLQLRPVELESPTANDAKSNGIRSADEQVNTMPCLEGDQSRELSGQEGWDISVLLDCDGA